MSRINAPAADNLRRLAELWRVSTATVTVSTQVIGSTTSAQINPGTAAEIKDVKMITQTGESTTLYISPSTAFNYDVVSTYGIETIIRFSTGTQISTASAFIAEKSDLGIAISPNSSGKIFTKIYNDTTTEQDFRAVISVRAADGRD